MEIVILSLGLPFNASTIKSEGLGGSESAAYYKAMELARRGHNVKVFTSTTDSDPAPTLVGTGQIQFIAAGQHTQTAQLGDRFEHYARNTPHDVLIIQRQPHAFHGQFSAKVCIFEHHDLGLVRYAAKIAAGAWQVGAFTAVSAWHKRQMEEVYGLNPSSVHVVPNGVDHGLYDISQGGEDPFLSFEDEPGIARLIYQSRPERGLEHLVRPGGIMDRLRDLKVKLYVFGYDNTTAEMAQYYAQLKGWAAALPNVQWIGAVDKETLARYQINADSMVYPTSFEEVSCITAMEAMCAGLPLLSSACAALPETCEGSGSVLLALKDGQPDLDAFVEKLTRWFGTVPDQVSLGKLEARQIAAAPEKTWARSVDALEAVIGDLFKSTTGAILRTAIEHSDIRFANEVLAVLPSQDQADDPIVVASHRELDHYYDFLKSDEAYAAHYAKHQGRYYDENDVVGEDVTRTTRFQGVYLLLKQRVDQAGGEQLRILDYGCAHGHYSMPLAKAFPDHQFVGLDVSPRAVETYNKWAARDELKNAEAWVAHLPEVPAAYGFTKYDAIIAGEVLEHVRDPYALLEIFRALLAPGGLLIITTPVGRWEHSGTLEFRNAREHVEHFERADINEMFAGHQLQVFSAPATHDRSGFQMGSYVYGVQFVDGAPIGRPDFLRKLHAYRPRETISACLIVKDGEQTLQKAIESVVDWVDEIIVVIDAKTTDGTQGVVIKLQDKFPFKAIRVWWSEKSASVDGFCELRNESIEKAVGDWILWFDADEEVRRPWNLHKLARPSMHQAFGFRQIHYSADPAQVLSTDMPCRFFRNHRGVKFFGLVHEHPEDSVGKGIPYSIVRPECEFLHNGYVDEETRRARFRRNYPLVLRDCELYPERKLNRFMMLRDLAHSLVHEREQIGFGIAPHHMENSQKGVDLFVKMLEEKGGHIGNRMLIDCLPYYSVCCETLGIGFDVEMPFKFSKDSAPDLAAQGEIKGRFHSVEFFDKFMHSISQEATAKYGSKYL